MPKSKKKPQGREVIPGEVRIAKRALISVTFLRRIWRHGGASEKLASRLGRATGLREERFLYGQRYEQWGDGTPGDATTATTAPTVRA